MRIAGRLKWWWFAILPIIGATGTGIGWANGVYWDFRALKDKVESVDHRSEQDHDLIIKTYQKVDDMWQKIK